MSGEWRPSWAPSIPITLVFLMRLSSLFKSWSGSRVVKWWWGLCSSPRRSPEGPPALRPPHFLPIILSASQSFLYHTPTTVQATSQEMRDSAFAVPLPLPSAGKSSPQKQKQTLQEGRALLFHYLMSRVGES